MGRRRRSPFRWRAPIFASFLCGCAGVADYSTAKLPPRGGFEVAPHATAFGALVPERFEGERIRQLWEAGGTLGYGVTRASAVSASYERNRFDEAGPLASLSDQRLSVAWKYAWEPLREAFSIGYGYHFGNAIHEVSAASYSNWYWKRSAYYCFSPSVTFFAVDGGSDRDWAFNAVLNQSFTWEFGRRYYLRPQIGINYLALFARVVVVNAGLAAGAGF